jgi:aminoglycoside 3-N-acetyltransferase
MNYSTFVKILKDLNIKRSDIVMLHSDLTNFLPDCSWLKKCETFYKYLDKYFGKSGTVLIPTFSYSFCKTGIYNKSNTKSDVGIFSEFYRNKKSGLRSDHPIFSFVCSGKYSKFFNNNNSNSATGAGSIFEKLLNVNGKILLFGVGIHSCTFLHFVEQSKKVPYRYSKYFKKKNLKYNKKYEFYVRNTEKFNFYDPNLYSKMEDELEKSKILNKIKKNKLIIKSTLTKDLYNFVSEKLNKNLHYIIGKKPKRIT